MAPGASDCRAGRCRFPQSLRCDQGLDPGLRGVGELQAVALEDLDPVVLEGVVGGGDHDGRIGLHVHGEEGHGRRGKHPHGEGIDAHGTDARHEGILDHRARKARVPADEDAVPAPRVAEEARDGLAHAKNELGRHGVLVGHPANPVRPEEFSFFFCHGVCPPPARFGRKGINLTCKKAVQKIGPFITWKT